jgi:hypothetical protein
MVPSNAEAMAVPERIAAPPLITVMNALAIEAAPMVGTTPVSGAKSPPARPDSAEPMAKVTA